MTTIMCLNFTPWPIQVQAFSLPVDEDDDDDDDDEDKRVAFIQFQLDSSV